MALVLKFANTIAAGPWHLHAMVCLRHSCKMSKGPSGDAAQGCPKNRGLESVTACCLCRQPLLRGGAKLPSLAVQLLVAGLPT